MAMKTLKKKHLIIFGGTLGVVLFISGFFIFAEKLLEVALARSGLPQSHVGRIDFALNGTVLTNVELPRLGVSIDELRLYATAGDIGHARLGKVIIKGIRWQPLQAHQPQASSEPLNLEGLRPLLAALDTYSSQIEIEDLTLTPAPDMPAITGTGTIYDRGDRYQMNFSFATPQPQASAPPPPFSLAATASADIFKSTGAVKAQADITQIDLYMPPALTAKRVSGWITFDLPAAPAAAPLIGAQITAGAMRLYDIPLSDNTLTVSGDAATLKAVLATRLPEKSGSKAGNGLQAEISLATLPAVQTLEASLTATLNDLETLGLANVGGSATVDARLQAQKDSGAALGDLAAYRDIAGTVNVAARKLSLAEAFSNATGTLAGKIVFDPAAKRITFENTAPLAFIAQRDKATWSLDTRKFVAVYDAASASYHLVMAQAGLAAPAFTLADGQADITVMDGAAPVAEGKLSGTLSTPHKPAYVVPLKFEATLNSLSSRQHTTGFNIAINGANGALMVKAQGSHDSLANKGDMRLRLVPIEMIEGVHALDEFFPVTGQYLSGVTGTLGALARMEWHKDNSGTWQVSQRGRLLLRDVGATYSDFPIVGINTVLSFDSLMPLSFARQQVAIGAFTAGLPLQNGLVTMSLDAQNRLSIHDGTMEMAGGRIKVSPFTLDLVKQQGDIVLSAENLDLKQIFAIAPLEGLSAEGRMQGRLPIAMRAGNLTLDKGELSSIGGGVIRYSPRELPAFLADDTNQHIVDLRTALANFNFSSLKMGLQGDLLKEQTINLNIEGNNPDFYGGHPVKLNLNVEGPLQNIVRYAPGNETIPDAIQKQFEQFEDANATVAP